MCIYTNLLFWFWEIAANLPALNIDKVIFNVLNGYNKISSCVLFSTKKNNNNTLNYHTATKQIKLKVKTTK